MPVKETDMIPFAMRFLDIISNEERGYDDFDVSYSYDAKSQVSNTITMGGTLVLTSFEEKDSDTKSDSED